MALDEARVQQVIAGHNTRNVGLRTTIAGYGIPLDKPRALDLEFFAPDEAHAKVLCEQLVRIEFAVLKSRPTASGDGRWAVTAGMHGSVDAITSPETVELIARFAGKYDCTYDGWGTALVELDPKKS